MAVACGYKHTLVVGERGGDVFACGRGDEGQLGRGTREHQRTPALVPGLPSVPRRACVVMVAAGAYHSAASTSAGELLVWGANSDGQLGLGDFIFYSMLVGRAAMSGTAAFVCCTIAVLSGLGGTLALLALTRHALPALPISIALGAVVYFTTTAAVSPFARAALGHGLVV